MTAVSSLTSATMLLAVPVLPLLLAGGLAIPVLRGICLRLAAWGAVPALAVALLLPSEASLRIPTLLLGTQFGIDETGRSFLLFTALLWWLAGLFGARYMADDPKRLRFTAFYLLAMAGSLGVNICLDLASFFVMFALMSISSYGLVVHNGDAAAKRAARIYIALVVLGEALLFAAIALIASSGQSALPYQDPTASDALIALVLLGFGIKAGALPLHVWLPLAHPAAPMPASAVLSGAMIKAGLLGWVRFLPLGVVNEPEWGLACVIAGLAAAFYGALVGAIQDNPKTVLAYSSISQMGLMTVPIGIALASPEALPLALTSVIVYALHHGLAKGALFLGVGVATHAGNLRWMVFLGLLLPAAALMGLPLTSGAVAKTALKSAVGATAWSGWLNPLLALAAIGTTLLMARFLVTLHTTTKSQHTANPGLWSSWLAVLLSVALLVWFWPAAQDAANEAVKLAKLWSTIWPAVLGALLAVMLWHAYWRRNGTSTEVPKSYLVRIIEAAIRRRSETPAEVLTGDSVQFVEAAIWRAGAHAASFMTTAERTLRDWPVAGVLFLLLLVLFFATGSL
ncbi:MAG: complex I subunit 5 family protein [Pseudomonadales bacterium]